MKKFIFSAFALCALAFASCSDDNKGINGETPNYEFTGSHMTFVYNLSGDLASMVKVASSTTLPATQATINHSTEGTKHIVTLSNIKCPAKFDIVYQITPKDGISIDANQNYSYNLESSFSIIRSFSDGSHIPASSESAPVISGYVMGKDLETFFKNNQTHTYKLNLSPDGFYEDPSEE